MSEVMAQQTQIERVGPRWAAFLERFPTVHALAAATPADVLRAWAGLGYNRRGLNLWRAARLIVARHDGRVPEHPAELAELPGIGPYTARAVAAIAFGRAVGPVDTNVRRVLGRVAFGTAKPSPAAVQNVADSVVATERPGDWTHAVMDIGATFCRAQPRCAACPVSEWCRFRAEDEPAADRESRASGQRQGVRFEATSRWLRGRILDRVRSDDDWVAIENGIGDHDKVAVRVAIESMTAEGLLELDTSDGEVRVRLPLA